MSRHRTHLRPLPAPNQGNDHSTLILLLTLTQVNIHGLPYYVKGFSPAGCGNAPSWPSYQPRLVILNSLAVLIFQTSSRCEPLPTFPESLISLESREWSWRYTTCHRVPHRALSYQSGLFHHSSLSQYDAPVCNVVCFATAMSHCNVSTGLVGAGSSDALPDRGSEVRF